MGTLLLTCLALLAGVQGFCIEKNPFLAKLAASGVQIFTRPEPSTSQLCAHEWQPFLTCCDAQKLGQYAQTKTQHDRLAYQDARNELQQASLAFAAAFREFSTLEDSISNCEALADLSPQITEFKKRIDGFFPITEGQKAQEQKCFNKTERIRNYVLCYTCSGRSEQFFQSGKARISLEDCKSVIDECSFLWGRSIQLIDALDLAQLIVTKLRKRFSSTLGSIQFTSAVNLRSWIDSMNLRNTVKLCTNSSAPTCDAASAKSVCENLVSVHQTSFVENALAAVRTEVAQLPSLNTATHAINSQVIETVRMNQEMTSRSGSDTRYGITSTESFNSMCSSSISTKMESTSESSGESPSNQGETLWNVGRRLLTFTVITNSTGAGDTQVTVNPPRNCTGCMPIGYCPDCP